MRAPTPSAAAEIVIATRASLVEGLNIAAHKLRQSMLLTVAVAHRRLHRVAVDSTRLRGMIGRRTQRVDELDYRMRDGIRTSLLQRTRALDVAAARLARKDVRLRFAEARRKAGMLDQSLRQLLQLRLRDARAALTPVRAKLEQLSPLTILERGYAIVERDGKIVKSPTDAPVDSTVRVRVAKGDLRAKIVN